jgi:hypothetical protein
MATMGAGMAIATTIVIVVTGMDVAMPMVAGIGITTGIAANTAAISVAMTTNVSMAEVTRAGGSSRV